MNPVVKIVNGIIVKINSIIDSIDLKTQETIKRAFLFMIFILCLFAISIGYKMGTNAAKIKSKPVAEYVNETFKLDMSNEKNNASFSSVLESRIISESTVNNFKKYNFPIKENESLKNGDNSIIDPQKKIFNSKSSDKTSTPIDPTLKPASKESYVKPLDKRNDTKSNIIIQNKTNKNVRPLKSTKKTAPKIYQENELIR